MAEVLCLEPIGGIAGDMFLALAVDLGVPLAELKKKLAGLGVPGWSIKVSRLSRHALMGTHLEVIVEGQQSSGEDHHHHHDHHHQHHDHQHSHQSPESQHSLNAHPAHHQHHSPDAHPSAAHHHRAYRDIKRIIQDSALAPREKERALAVFAAVAKAEASVHGMDVEEIRFHEVGAIDSIVDGVGAAVALEMLGSPEVYCSPPPMGSGLVKRAHGMMPIPPPATVEILRGRTVRFEGVGELTTPTGAAIVAALTQEGPFPEMVLEKVGYGVGSAEFNDRPNVLRGLLGRRAHGEKAGTYVLEANLDDASPQVLAFAAESLLAAGALDVWIAPVIMKKGRPGHLLGVLAPGDQRDRLTQVILQETTTLGVRTHRVDRLALERDFQTVQTPWGEVRIKIGLFSGTKVNAAPEYEDCARIAREHQVPLKQVLAAALAQFNGR